MIEVIYTLYKDYFGGFDAWPINTEFPGDDTAIFRVTVGVFHRLAFHCKTLKTHDILTEYRGIVYVSENIWSWKG